MTIVLAEPDRATLHAIFFDARTLLTDPARWHRGSFARDAQGHAVAYHAPTACAWCIAGAVLHCADAFADRPWGLDALKFLTLVRVGMTSLDPAGHLAGWNDQSDRQHADVLALLDAAIEATAPGAAT